MATTDDSQALIEPKQTSVETLEQTETLPDLVPEIPIPEYVDALCRKAKSSATKLAALPASIKNQALTAMAEQLEARTEEILAANEKDVEAFGDDPARKAMADRLCLTPERVRDMALGLREIVKLPDPLGSMPKMWMRPNGMQVGRMRVPIGVIAMIYESRPNVTVDSAGLCLKSGNVCILRGGSEAIHSNRMLATILTQAAEEAGVPPGAITFVDRPDREVVPVLLAHDREIDVVIPRGGESLMKTVAEHAAMPVIKHDAGVCHMYVDHYADVEMAVRLCVNAKVQRPATCNATETVLVHQTVARTFLPPFIAELQAAKVDVRGCAKTQQICPDVTPAVDEDFGQEFLSLTVAVKVVKSFDDAVEHIGRHGSQHTESIVTQDYSRAMRFLKEVDASAVLVNASTRLNDGFQFGLGAEIGISTSRIHARGPMGLEELTCTKFVVFGTGQIRE